MIGSYNSNIPDLLNVMKDYAELRGLDLSDVITDQAAKLSCSDFGGNNRGLFQLAADFAPTPAELKALPQKLGWRIKRKGRPVFTRFTMRIIKKGKRAGQERKIRVKRMTGPNAGKSLAKGEISIRIARRFYQAIGWLSPALSKYERQIGGPSARQKKKAPPASVTLRLEGDKLEVIITNRATNAAEVNARHGNYIQVALDARKADMVAYINRKLEEMAQKLK